MPDAVERKAESQPLKRLSLAPCVCEMRDQLRGFGIHRNFRRFGAKAEDGTFLFFRVSISS